MSASAERLPEAIVCKAIEWQMRLRDQPHHPELQAQLMAWRQRDGRHELAWLRLGQLAGQFDPGRLPDAAQTSAVLRQAEVDVGRRRMLSLLGVGLAVGSGALLLSHTAPGWRSDFATATGERRRVPMAAGGEVLLNTDSAVDIEAGRVVLRSGEVLLDGPSWVVGCRFASCEGRGARAVVRERAGFTEVHVARGQVLVRVAGGVQQLAAGDGVAVDGGGIRPLVGVGIDPFGWSRGVLVASDVGLGEFLAEAGRYRAGWLGCDAGVAGLRLSGVFRLDDPEGLLGNIERLLPVRVVERTRWWVRVVAV